MKRSRNNNQKASRVGPAAIKYIDIVTDKLATTASTYRTDYYYNVKQLLPTLQAAKSRFARFKRFVMNFSPTEAQLGTSLQQVGVQLEALDVTTGYFIPVTKMLTLSETNPRTLSFNLGTEFARWFRSDDSSKIILIAVYNIASVPTVTDFTVTVRSEVDLQLPEPSAV